MRCPIPENNFLIFPQISNLPFIKWFICLFLLDFFRQIVIFVADIYDIAVKKLSLKIKLKLNICYVLVQLLMHQDVYTNLVQHLHILVQFNLYGQY